LGVKRNGDGAFHGHLLSVSIVREGGGGQGTSLCWKTAGQFQGLSREPNPAFLRILLHERCRHHNVEWMGHSQDGIAVRG
jgi:hypothetical protein